MSVPAGMIAAPTVATARRGNLSVGDKRASARNVPAAAGTKASNSKIGRNRARAIRRPDPGRTGALAKRLRPSRNKASSNRTGHGRVEAIVDRCSVKQSSDPGSRIGQAMMAVPVGQTGNSRTISDGGPKDPDNCKATTGALGFPEPLAKYFDQPASL